MLLSGNRGQFIVALVIIIPLGTTIAILPVNSPGARNAEIAKASRTAVRAYPQWSFGCCVDFRHAALATFNFGLGFNMLSGRPGDGHHGRSSLPVNRGRHARGAQQRCGKDAFTPWALRGCCRPPSRRRDSPQLYHRDRRLAYISCEIARCRQRNQLIPVHCRRNAAQLDTGTTRGQRATITAFVVQRWRLATCRDGSASAARPSSPAGLADDAVTPLSPASWNFLGCSAAISRALSSMSSSSSSLQTARLHCNPSAADAGISRFIVIGIFALLLGLMTLATLFIDLLIIDGWEKLHPEFFYQLSVAPCMCRDHFRLGWAASP